MPTQTDRLYGLNTALAYKAPVKSVATTNTTLSGEQTVGGVALVDGDRVLLPYQTDATENGIYVVSTTGWSRAADFDGNRDAIAGTQVLVLSDYSTWVLTTTGAITIGTTSLAFARRETRAFDVRLYGAVGDGTTDDSAAFTAAFAALRASVNAAAGGSHTLLIPPGKYRINTSINATMINPGTDGPKVLVIGYGADINGYCTAKPVFDAVGSAHISWEGLYVEGISGSEPVSAFQIGRYADGVTASNNSFRNVKTWGYFSRTALHNLASEQNQYLHCSFGIRGTATLGAFSTYNTGNTQFAAIFDGINYFGATSDYVDMSGLTQYTAQSFLNNSIYNCSFRGGQSGDRGGGLLLMAVDSFRTQDSYVVGRGGWPGTVIGVYSGNNSNGVSLDLHSETSDSGDLGYCVYFKDMDSTSSQINCEEFMFTEVSVHAQTAVIGTNLSSSVVLLNNASINIGGFQNGAPTLLPLFDTPARYRVSGDITWTRGESFQGTALSRFTGEIYAKISNSTVTVSDSGGHALFTYTGSNWWTSGNKVQLTTAGLLPTGFSADTVYYVASPNTATSTVTVSNSGGDALFTYTGTDSWANGTTVTLSTTTTLPTGFNSSTTYYVVGVDTGANTFKLSATTGGAAIVYTDAGTGTHTAATKSFKLSATASPLTPIAFTDAGTGTHTVRIDFQRPSSPSAYTLRDMSDNTIKYYGDHITTQSAYFPAGAMVPRTTNGAALNTTELSTNKIMLQTMDFDATTQEYAQFRVTMPKSWDGSAVRFKAYWSHSGGSGYGVAWSLACRGFGNSDTLDYAMGTATVVTDTGGADPDLWITAESDGVIPAGSVANEEELVFEVSRVTGNASDTLTVDARLHGILIKYGCDKASDE